MSSFWGIVLYIRNIILLGDVLLLGYSIVYKKYNLTRFNHQKKHYSGEPTGPKPQS